MKTRLTFLMNLNFDLTINEQLSKFSLFKFWDKGNQKYLYVFPLDKLNEIVALTGKEIRFDDQEQDIMNLIHHAPMIKETIIKGKEKGVGFIHIQKFPKLFIITTMMNKKEQKFQIPIGTVIAAWKAIKSTKKTSSKEVAEYWCNNLGIGRFHRKTGNFDSDKMYGERRTYFKWYYSLKVLEHYKVIKYEKTGKITRLKDSWELEGKLYV